MLLSFKGRKMGLKGRSCVYSLSIPYSFIMLESLISSRTRIKLLLRFFLNPQQSSYLRALANEFNESTNSVRIELNRLEEAGLVNSSLEGNKKMFRVNPKHPLFHEIRSLVMKHLGIDQLIESMITNLGDLKRVYLAGDLAKGMNSELIDVVLVGDIDMNFLVKLISKTEKLLSRKIRFLNYISIEKLPKDIDQKSYLLIWKSDI